ncbi:MAG: cryptochrome/photolyase family protein, partial [Clostridia bacterium]
MAVLVWFRRDLRLHDHTALYQAVQTGEPILPVFVIDERIYANGRMSAKRLHAFFSALRALAANVEHLGGRLMIKRGDPVIVLSELSERFGTDKLYYNRDYTPSALERDNRVEQALGARGVVVQSFKDLVMHEGHELLNKQGKPYVVFTPYRRAWLTLPKDKPLPLPKSVRWVEGALAWESDPVPELGELGLSLPDEPFWQQELFGERVSRERLRRFLETGLYQYRSLRDQPAVEGTSRLSFALKAGTLSIRTVYHLVLERLQQASGPQAEEAETFISELVWREFYQQVLVHFPHTTDRSFLPAFDQVEWDNNEELFHKWCIGETGYPIVDAGMRQLNQTGWMHNRVRMITASFLTKDLLVDWRKGMAYFAEQLIDCDEAANSGGWQWCASTGTDAQPYFRIFNPVSQGEKFDPDGEYVKRYVP